MADELDRSYWSRRAPTPPQDGAPPPESPPPEAPPEGQAPEGLELQTSPPPPPPPGPGTGWPVAPPPYGTYGAPPPGYGAPPPPGWGGPPPWKGAKIGRPPHGPGALAEPGRRLAARLLDGLVLLPVFGVIVAVTLVLAVPHVGPIFPRTNEQGTAQFPGFFWIWIIVFGAGLATGVVSVAYETIATARYGRTLGKAWMHIRPLRVDGAALSWGRALGRAASNWAAGFLSWIGLLDPLWCLWDDNRQCVHDKIADTIVVDDGEGAPSPGYGTPQVWAPSTPSAGTTTYPPPPPGSEAFGYVGPPPGYPPPYAAPPWFAYPPSPRANGLAVASLVCSIVGFFLLGVPSIVGIVLGFVGRARIRRSAGAEQGSGLATAGVVVGFVAVALWVLIFVLPAVFGSTRSTTDFGGMPLPLPPTSGPSLVISGAPGYSTFTGPEGLPLAVGTPWGTTCKPIVYSVSAEVPDDVYTQIVGAVDAARAQGIDVTVEDRHFGYFPSNLYPPGLTNGDVEFVTIFADAKVTPTLPSGNPEHIDFGWDAKPSADGNNDVLTDLQATLYLRNLTGPASDRLATRQLIAFSQGVAETTVPGSGIARGSTVDTLTPSDVHAILTMSGCTPPA